MANCLVTTLKESVNNDALIGMESVRITVKAMQNPTNNQRTLRLGAISNPITVIAKGNGGFSTTLEGAIIKELTIQPSVSYVDLYFVNDNYYIEITDKHNIKEIQPLAAGMFFSDVSHCSYMNNIRTLAMLLAGNIDCIKTMPNITVFSSNDNADIFGDIASIQGNTSLQHLYLEHDVNITGDIAVIGTMPSIFTSVFTGTQVGGAIDDLVANLVLNNNPNQGIAIGTIWNNITLGGVSLTATLGAYTGYVFWENNGAKIFVVNGTNRNYTPENTRNIFCKGYTAQEVAEKWPDYTVVRVDE